MPEMTNRYEIETLNDFVKVPAARLDACLAEFAVAVNTQRALGRLLNSTADVMFGVSEGIATVAGRFVWIDDDFGQMTIKLGTTDNGGVDG